MPSAREWIVEAGRLVRFALVGVLASLLYALVTYAIAAAGIATPVVAAVGGSVAAGFVSYFGHLHFSFAVEPNHRVFVRRFVVITALVFLVNIGTTWLMTAVLKTSYVYSIIVVMALIPGISYLCNRFWIFEPGLTRRGAQMADPHSGPVNHDG